MAINLKELNEIQNEINGLSKIPVMRLNFNRRYSLYSNVIKEKLLNPNSSKSIQININTKDYSQSNNWLADKSKSGGIIIGEACHFIDLAKFFTGSKVPVLGSSVPSPYFSDNLATSAFSLACSSLHSLFIASSLSTKEFTLCSISIFCTAI